MYCPSCGLQLTRELRYCPRCGANLNPPAKQEESSTSLVGPIWAVSLAVTLITLTGLGLVFAFGIVVLVKGVSLPLTMLALVFFFLLVLLTIVVLLIRQLSRLLSMHEQPADAAHAPYRSADTDNELEAGPAPQLEAPREPPLSVTENTTRALEHLPGERQTR